MHRKIIYLILFTFLSSVQCKKENKLMEWCITSEYEDVNKKIVNKESCRTRPCIVFSCPYNEMVYNRRCKKMADFKIDFSEMLSLYKFNSGKLVKTNKTLDNKHFQIVTYKNKTAYKESECTGIYESVEETKVHFMEDGSFLVLPDTIVPAGEYIIRLSANNVSGTLKPELKYKIALNLEDDGDIWKDIFFGSVMLVSCFFIILLLVVYALCKDLRTTPGVILMACVAAFGISFLLLTIREFTTIFKTIPAGFGCYVLSIFIRFFTLNSYCWMSIMSFNIWWTLRSMFYKHTSPGKTVDYRKFAWYCCVASVPPTIYVIVEVYLNEYSEHYSPKFGSCSAFSSVWHVGAVLLPLQVFNSGLFVMTAYNLCRIQRSNQGHLNNSNSGSTGPTKQTALIIIKISVMMGINWYMDLFMLFFDEKTPDFVKYPVKMYNTSIGVIMFLMNVIKVDVLLKLFRKLSINNGITRHLERRMSKQLSNKSKSSHRSESTSTYAVNSHQDPDGREVDHQPSDRC